MNDLISRQAAIDKFEPWLKVRGYSEGELNMLKAVLYELRFLPSAQPESQWILCNWHTKEENLPQECKSVLICMKESYGYRIGVSYRTDYNRWEGFGRVNVIAWMPLPWIPLPGEARMENE